MHRSRLVTGIAAVAFLLLGCSGPDDDVAGPSTPTATTPSSASPSPPPSPPPSPTPTHEAEPEPGPGFERDDEIGAQAAARYAIDVLLYTVRTGNEDALNRLEWPETCKICNGARNVMKERHEEAASIEGGEATVEILKVYSFDEVHGGYPLNIRVTESDSQLLDARGNLVRVEAGSTEELRIELLHDGTTWRLINIIDLKKAQ